MQSCVLWALMQEILANELTVARGSTAVSALDSSAHFLCSRSERVHHRNFFPGRSKKKGQDLQDLVKKNTQFKTLWKKEVILFNFTSKLILLTRTQISTYSQAPKRCAQAVRPGSLLPNRKDNERLLLNLY